MPSRGTTTQRGYGSDHQRERAELLPFAYGLPCPRCGQTMHQGQDLDLGHPEHPDEPRRIEHARCNRAAGAVNSNRSPYRRRQRRYRGHVSVDAHDL